MHSLQSLLFQTHNPPHLKETQKKHPCTHVIQSTRAFLLLVSGTGCWCCASGGFFMGNASRSVSPRWKERQGKTASSCGSIETVKLPPPPFYLKAKVNAIGNLHIFSWWEGDFFTVSLVSSCSMVSSKTFNLLYLCLLKHKGRKPVLSCLRKMLQMPWKRHIKQCLVSPWVEKGRAEELHTSWIRRAPLTSVEHHQFVSSLILRPLGEGRKWVILSQAWTSSARTGAIPAFPVLTLQGYILSLGKS